MARYSKIKWANTSDKTLKSRGEKGTLCVRDTNQLKKKPQPKLALLDHLYITCELIGYKIKINFVLKYDCN